ncbi:odorant receptor 323 [Tribolium castaneum]|uniref:Odorant receptor n=1 Tax=Tribolium castaneum TaxID=7070 RepID=D6WBP0_TRICA|nr:PREDICTED: uncharacterized protein LOC107398667 [Tribolium castaneum]EEZ99350.1 odorant receptor 323 [Tribolium castaneum]|eukprot:XP_015839083.1 PREDICTED: uncharacterized protein LOC107398667 [Tribolium castaneum]
MNFNFFDKSDDFSMPVVYFVAEGIFHIKFIRFLAYLALISNALGLLLMLYQFVLDAESLYIIKYGPVLSGAIFALVSLHAILFMRDLETFKQEFDCWSEHDASQETQNRIKQHINSVTIFVIFNSVLAFVAGVSLVLPSKDEVHYHYFIKILLELEVVPRGVTRTVYYLYKIDYVVMYPILTINSVRMLYFSRKFKFQVKLLVDRIVAMTKDNVDDLSLFYSTPYQNDMARKLKTFVRRHSYIAQYVAKINKSIGPFVVTFSLSATLMGISVLLIAAAGTFYYNKYQIILCGAMYLCTLCSAIDATETVEMESIEIYNALLAQPWYIWNNENKKVLIIFLMNCEKPIQITKFSDVFYYNYDWGISVLRKAYSLGSVFFNLRQYIGK